MAEQNLEQFSKFIADNKGKRKFKQTVELAINFKDIDFTKQDSKLNVDVNLPNGKGSKVKKIAIFATERNMIEEAKKNNIEVINGNELDSIKSDNARLSSLVNYELIAQPNLMPVIAKSLGQFLGPRNKMPKPLLGNVNMAAIANELNKRVTIRNKGKNLPTIHCIVGTEDMEPQKLYENINEVVNTVSKKIGANRIRSVYVKLTMSAPMRLM
ncbi:MAG: 50S ribosomal protein L1 [Candidatus Micrarchaeota archaeon]|nr:50S ribosomal protein L1 [Candidatus Micrarchaeota archaeon]